MKFSLIIATLGRKVELDNLLQSVLSQNYKLSEIEIIIVDQNEKGFLNDIIEKFDTLNIVYIHSENKGLSLNRNIGLKRAIGEIICFSDDDCLFYKDTLDNVVDILKDKVVGFCIGRIYDREHNKDIIKKWPKKEFPINKFNSYFVNSSITLFVKKEDILYFDENLGVGAKYGSCEDADYIYRLLENKIKGIYTPKIELWHPEVNYRNIPLCKVKNYASGFGYFIRKDTDLTKRLLLLLLISKKCIQMIFNIVNKRFQKNYFKYYFNGLNNGLKEKNDKD